MTYLAYVGMKADEGAKVLQSQNTETSVWNTIISSFHVLSYNKPVHSVLTGSSSAFWLQRSALVVQMTGLRPKNG